MPAERSAFLPSASVPVNHRGAFGAAGEGQRSEGGGRGETRGVGVPPGASCARTGTSLEHAEVLTRGRCWRRAQRPGSLWGAGQVPGAGYPCGQLGQAAFLFLLRQKPHLNHKRAQMRALAPSGHPRGDPIDF